MTEKELETQMIDNIMGLDDARFAYSFEESGVLTNNRGFTITMDDESEFQITIVKISSAGDQD